MNSNSAIIRSIYIFVEKLNEAYKSSLIIRFFMYIAAYLDSLFGNSGFSRIIRSLGAFFKKLGSGSFFVNFVKRDDHYSRVIDNSRTYKLFGNIVNGPSRLFGKLYDKMENTLDELWLMQIFKALLRRFDILVGLSVAFILVVPHNYWFNGYSTIIAAGLFVLFFFNTIIRRHDSFNVKAIDLGLMVFFITIVLAEISSYYPMKGISFFVFFITCFLMVLLIISSIKTAVALNRFTEIMLAGVTITGLYGVWQKIVGVPFDPSLTDAVLNEGMPGRIFSTLQNPNSYAEALVLTIPFFIAIVLNSKTFFKKMVYIVMALPVLVALFATGSRSSWIACAFSILVFVFFKNKKLIPLIIAGGVIGFLLLPYISEPTYRRIMTLFGNDSSVGYRTLIYKTIKPIFKDHWVAGVGLGPQTFMEICKNYKLYTGKVVPPHTHNLYLQIWIEGGIISILAFLWFLGRLVKKSIKVFSTKGNENIESVKNILISGVAALAGICVMGLGEYVWFYPRVMLLFWIIAGVMLAGISIAVSKIEMYGE